MLIKHNKEKAVVFHGMRGFLKALTVIVSEQCTLVVIIKQNHWTLVKFRQH